MTLSKTQRIQNIIQRLQEIENSKHMDFILDDRIIKAIESLLQIKPYQKRKK